MRAFWMLFAVAFADSTLDVEEAAMDVDIAVYLTQGWMGRGGSDLNRIYM